MNFYVGIDLHSTNSYIGIIDKTGKKVSHKKVQNDINTISATFEPLKERITGIVIESTFNWYWLVDELMEKGYKVHLANPAAMQQYSGLKYTDDKSDAFWLAEMLRLKILPEGYIYPKQERYVRDLLRKRMQLVQHRTALFLSMKSMISNCTTIRLSRSERKDLENEEIRKMFDDPYQVMSAESLNDMIKNFNVKIEEIEKTVLKAVKLRKEFKKLLTVWGIGKILGLTIMLETGDIKRFAKVGDYSSYSRCVSTKKMSNGKKKGKGNKKNGNRYLAWAYVEAAHYMQRYYSKARKWYQKKAAKSGNIIAVKALSNKIARACYFVLKDRQDFNPIKLFG